jgi:glycosyltransferase involved in cell wall biosynthesis
MTYILSLIIPAYKPDQFIDRFIENLYKLDDKLNIEKLNFEVIFIHSETTEIDKVKKLIFKNITIVYVYNKDKLNPSEARNIGIKLAKGDYLHFHDVDDFILTNFIKDIVTKLIANRLYCFDVIIYKYHKVRENKLELIDHDICQIEHEINSKELLNYISKYILEPHIYTAFVHCWSKIYKSEFIRKNCIRFDEKLEQLEDVNFNFKILNSKPALYASNIILYDYSVASNNNENLSSKSGDDPDKDLKFLIRALKPVRKYCILNFSKKIAYIKINHLYATTIVLWILRIRKRKKYGFKKKYEKINAYCDSKLVVNSLRFYNIMPNTSIIIPLLVKLKLPLFLSI